MPVCAARALLSRFASPGKQRGKQRRTEEGARVRVRVCALHLCAHVCAVEQKERGTVRRPVFWTSSIAVGCRTLSPPPCLRCGPTGWCCACVRLPSPCRQPVLQRKHRPSTLLRAMTSWEVRFGSASVTWFLILFPLTRLFPLQ